MLNFIFSKKFKLLKCWKNYKAFPQFYNSVIIFKHAWMQSKRDLSGQFEQLEFKYQIKVA